MEQGLYLFTQNIWHGGFQKSNHQVVDANDPWDGKYEANSATAQPTVLSLRVRGQREGE